MRRAKAIGPLGYITVAVSGDIAGASRLTPAGHFRHNAGAGRLRT